jgi:hypothetical protein
MYSCACLACALLVLLVSVPAWAGAEEPSDPLVVLRGDLLEAGELGAPFADPGPVVGGFVLRSDSHADLRVDPGVARLSVRGGALRAKAADPSEDRYGLLELCRLGLVLFPCATTLPFRPEPNPVPPIPLIPIHSDPNEALGVYLTDEQQALLGCGPYYGTVCDATAFFLPGVRSNGRFGRRDFVWIGGDPDDGFFYSRDVDPRTGRPRIGTPVAPFVWLDPEGGFQSEMAVLSWNAIMALVAASQSEGEPTESTLDPSDPYRRDGCSFAAPHFCVGVGGFFNPGWRFTALPDDPRGGDPLRWLWESAIAYDIVHARGELAAFRDGRLYVYGPFESPIEGFGSGVGLLLVPPQGAVPDATSPMVRVAPGLDRTFDTGDDSVVGFAWGAAWPGFDGVSEPRRQSRGRGLGHARVIRPSGQP